MTLLGMLLTLEEAAARLGKSVRQIRYMIQCGNLRAEKRAGRWFVDLRDPDLPSGPQAAAERKQRELRAAVHEVLDLDPEPPRQRRYSLRDMKAFPIAVELHRRAMSIGESEPATRALALAIEALAIGCHRFEHAEKAAAYRDARDHASRALSALALSPHDEAPSLADAIEQDLMAAFAGLLRRVDRRRRY
jgi:hypothetical protein